MEPTMSSAVAQVIGADKAMTFDLSNACAGMRTGVTVANNWIRQGSVERALVFRGSTSRNSGEMQRDM
jgi:3-oxoacyl-[acyl-carrier-protein] synthase-3